MTGFALFETAIGRCGIAWGERGIVGVQLPETGDGATRARLARRFAATEAPPPPEVQEAIAAIVALLRGEGTDLAHLGLDMSAVPEFHRRVYEAARRIPPGATRTYGEIATALGAPGSARAVGQALGRNPFAIVVPCHRVLAAGGRTGGFSANGGVSTKLRMLAIEGAPAQAALFDGDGRYGYDPRVAVEHLRGVDPALARVVDAVGPYRLELKRTPSIYAALAEAIVYQQLSGKAAATIYGRVCALFPRAHEGPTPENVLRAPDEKLRGAGLSRPKILALRDLAQRQKAGEIPTLAEAHRLGDDALIERLTAVRGIGRWTVEMLLMFRLGRADVLPVDDLGIRTGVGLLTRKRELPDRAAVARRGARWAPYRTVASWYLWRAVERSRAKA
ncbi:MAG: methylated-DNA--[protein]-cysteine S-methyltransferase [bacterium]|nr:methylated-DNA--[protein]-cysteine S-methyltransferase [bacterium]